MGTILINISGSFVIGFFGTLTLAAGRYTTFSSFSLQTLDLMRSGAMTRAALNIGLSVALCVGAVAVGHFIAARFNDDATAVAQLDIEEEAS